ncbi:MAG: S41 family peptidase [Rhodospirillales bacterium]
MIALLAAMVALGATISPALNGCSGDYDGQRYAQAGASDAHRWGDNSSSDELGRFNAVFKTYATDPGNTRQLKHFRDAYKRIRAAYVDDVPEQKLIDAAIAGVQAKEPAPASMPAAALVEAALDSMTASLDPHSAYLNPEELRESEMVTSGEFGGLGIQVTQEEGRIKVISPIEGTPADRAGLKPGDVISAIDGKPVDGMTLRDAVNAMRGEPGSRIRLGIQRDDDPPFEVAITRAVITIEPLRWRLEGNVGYLRIVSFNEKVADGVETAIAEMKRNTGGKLQGLVIDLRNNPGGLLDQSLAVSDEFLQGGTIVSIRGRELGSDRTFRAERGDLIDGLPIVVLINAGSASASEIVAAALQDHQRATVIGTRSFGKGSVQTVMRLPVEGALKLTTALYYTPSGEAIQARGVIPDVALTGGDDGGEPAHEIDLPGALPAQGEARHSSQGAVDVKACPAVGENGDRELGCAINLLRAGSPENFLASLGLKARL